MLRALSELIDTPVRDFNGECIDDQPIHIDDYTFTNRWLVGAANGPAVSETLVSHLLKSNCPITHQPDWGVSANPLPKVRVSTARRYYAIWSLTASIMSSMNNALNEFSTI